MLLHVVGRRGILLGSSRRQRIPLMNFWAILLLSFNATSLRNQRFVTRNFNSASIGSLKMSTSGANNNDGPSEVSAAELVARATSSGDILVAVQTLVYPGEERLHFQTQPVHQRKRQKVASNALKRLVKFLVGVSVSNERHELVEGEQFYRLCMCATASINDKKSDDNGSFSYWLSSSDVSSYLDALYCLGALAPLPSRIVTDAVNPLLSNLNSLLSDRRTDKKNTSAAISPSEIRLKATEISSLEWALQRIRNTAFTVPVTAPLIPSMTETSNVISTRKNLKLPFEILHGIVKGVTTVEEMRAMVPFKAETLQTRDGKLVSERRETCWMADEGVGGLGYSGKIMVPVPFTRNVAAVRDAIEKQTGIYYDCCLINWYDDGECACKFHSDPDHGRLWSYDTVVVSLGETRRFNLREIPPSVSGAVMTKGAQRKETVPPKSKGSESEQDHHSFHLFDGDVFYMTDDCQDTFQHCVMKSEGPTNDSPRSSIVFKKSLPGLGGRRGHGVVKTKNTAGMSTSAGASPRDGRSASPAKDVSRSLDRNAVKPSSAPKTSKAKSTSSASTTSATSTRSKK